MLPGHSGSTGLAQEIIAGTGTQLSRFPTAGQLVSWAKFAPKARQSAGRAKAATTSEAANAGSSPN